MKRYTIKYFLPVVGLLLVFSSCTERIELKTSNTEPVVVIYGCLSDQATYQTIRVSLSSPYFELAPNKPVSDAIVSMQTSDNETIEMIETDDKGVYRTLYPMAATVGTTYHLSVQVDFNQSGNMKIYEATATMQRPFLMDTIDIEVRPIMGFKHYALNLYAQEDEGPDYYCAYPVINDDTLATTGLSRYTVFSDLGIDGQYLSGLPLMMFDDVENRDLMGGDDSYFNFVTSGDKITCCISLIDRGYYDFLIQCQNERQGENPFFGGPASNITTNISNGGIGYFAAFCTTKMDAYVP